MVPRALVLVGCAVLLLSAGGVLSAEAFSASLDCASSGTLVLASSAAAVVATLTQHVPDSPDVVVPVALTPGAVVTLPCAGVWEFAAPDQSGNSYSAGMFPDGRASKFWLAGAGLLCGSMFAYVVVRAAAP